MVRYEEEKCTQAGRQGENEKKRKEHLIIVSL
jgi:hypothetical protein